MELIARMFGAATIYIKPLIYASVIYTQKRKTNEIVSFFAMENFLDFEHTKMLNFVFKK